MVFGNQVNTPSGIAYRYSPTQNNGQITQAVDSLSGETIGYQYDALKRLASASATPTSGSSAPAWAQSFQYDGFGNLTSKVLNGTAAPIPVNAATNQLSNAYYDANGNMFSGAGGSFGYDVANRMTSAAEVSGGQEIYAYAPDGKQIFKSQCGFFFSNHTANGMEGSCPMEYTLYGAYGEKLTVFNIAAQGNPQSYVSNFVFLPMGANVRFAGQMIQSDSGPVFQDRLGSNRAGGAQYYPYGDEVTSTSNDRVKFATYTRDSYTGLDYAQQRYYASIYGRFNTPDPYQASAGGQDPSTPSSWNRYAYVQGDPVNSNDPRGLDIDDPRPDPDDDDDDGGGGGWIASNCNPFILAIDPNAAVYCSIYASVPIIPIATPAPPPTSPPSCSISVASSGTPKGGQNLVGLTLYSPLTNTLGPYSTVGRPGEPAGYQGWLYAAQIQATLSGDPNPADWTPTQTVTNSGTLQIQGLRGPVTSVPVPGGTSPDNPTYGINSGIPGSYYWLDETGLGKYQPGGGVVVGGTFTQTLTSTLADGSASCSTAWSVTVTVPPGRATFGRLSRPPQRPRPQ